ncbi:prepilin-type N-terminal cleavage/methylation domain-containing protein [Francisella sp. LA112445]|uniref:prepilin-type N-terminal cleavage/methylation domain-containing protein n=1 Tax=Francisella sp. LA112445 TaxID=1395624 RepID=UPI001788E1C6|nr:prepilin-type N-terminal cleavage/methylation domain-containing protein [Francisella sp. LA112445]QIW10414.1 prepilin-type N-terminal cleavage/methylation domain-containing protein [Francisella sp. LA112445]
MRITSKNGGLTIVELLVVIAIIAIIAAIAVPMYSTHVVKTKISNTRYEADPYVKELRIYTSTHTSFPPADDSTWRCDNLDSEYVSRICLVRESETAADIEVYLASNVLESGSFYKYILSI